MRSARVMGFLAFGAVAFACPGTFAQTVTGTASVPAPEPPAAPSSNPEPRRVATETEAQPAAAVETHPKGPLRGFDVIRESDKFRLRLGGTVQFDGRMW